MFSAAAQINALIASGTGQIPVDTLQAILIVSGILLDKRHWLRFDWQMHYGVWRLYCQWLAWAVNALTGPGPLWCEGHCVELQLTVHSAGSVESHHV